MVNCVVTVDDETLQLVGTLLFLSPSEVKSAEFSVQQLFVSTVVVLPC